MPSADILSDEMVQKALDTIVTLETLQEFEPAMRKIMIRRGYHPRQAEQLLKRNRELMEEGLRHGVALDQAMLETGLPGKRCALFWDKELEAEINARIEEVSHAERSNPR